MTAPDHRPHAAPTDLVTAEDVAEWLRERAEEEPRSTAWHLHERLTARLDRERRQACERGAEHHERQAAEYASEATAGPRRMVFAVRAYEEWHEFSARLRAAEAEVERLRALSAEARDMLRDMPWRRGGDALVTRLDRAALGEP